MNNMASRVAYNNFRSLPVHMAFAYEGTVTRPTVSFSPMGGQNEGAVSYSAPIVKGDFVKFYSDATNKSAAGIVVQKAGTSDVLAGIAVSDPQGIDNTTADSGTPAYNLRRRVDVAFFGDAIIEVTLTGTVTAGSRVAAAFGASTTAPSANGGLVHMISDVSGAIVPVLTGFSGVLGV